MAYLAGVTTRVRLLTHVAVIGLRHPLQVAKTVATLDRLSGGRVILGVGAGHLAGEFAALGVPFADRGNRLDEAIDAVRVALSDEVPVHERTRYAAAGCRHVQLKLRARDRAELVDQLARVGAELIPALRGRRPVGS